MTTLEFELLMLAKWVRVGGSSRAEIADHVERLAGMAHRYVFEPTEVDREEGEPSPWARRIERAAGNWEGD